MNTEKLEKLKKSLDNKFIPDNMKDKIRAEIKKLEADIKTDETITATEVKEEVKEIEKKVEKALEVAEEKEEKAEAKKEEAEERAEAKAEEKKAKKSRTKTQKVEGKPKSAKKSVFSIAKEIRKDGETWEEAKDRARKMMKSETTETKKKTKTETQKLLAMVRRNKEYKKLTGSSNLAKDATRRALPRGKRVSANGNVYYENRANRVDVGGFKNAYLENGGGVDGVIELKPLALIPLSTQLNRLSGYGWTYGDWESEDGGKPSTMPNSVIVNVHTKQKFRLSPFYIYEGYDHYNSKPLYRVEDASEEGEYVGEWYTKREDAEQELKEMFGSYADKGVYVETLDEEIDLTDDGKPRVIKTQQGGDKSFGERREMHGASPEALAFDNGGTIIGTPETPLARGLDIDYTGLVGETGGMSAGEMFAMGGSLGNHGLKQGDQIIKTMSGGVQKVKTKSGDIFYVNLANGYRGSEPPLPFANGGQIEKYKSQGWKKTNRSTHGFDVYSKKIEEDTHYAVFDKRGNFLSRSKNNPQQAEIEAYQYMTKYAKGGGVRTVGNRVYSYGRNWTNDHRHVNKSEKHEVNYNRKRSFDDGGQIEKSIRFTKNDYERLVQDSSEDYPFYSTKNGINQEIYKEKDEKKVAIWNSNKEILRITNDSDLIDWLERNSYNVIKYDDGGFMTDPNFGDFQNQVYAEKGAKVDNQFNYMMLSRLQMDCDYYLGYGNRNEKVLWAGNVDDHIAEMKKLWNNLPKNGKPEWLTMEDILDYEKKMKSDNYATGGVTKNYIGRNQLNTITIKKGDKKLTYKVSDVYNGAYKLEEGGNLEKTAFYVSKRNVVKVQLKDGRDVKVANGYWIKKGAKPIHTSKYDDGGEMDYAGGGKTTFKEKATAIAKKFEGKRVEPKYQKEYGETYDKAEAKEVGNKIAGSQKAKYDAKMSGGGSVVNLDNKYVYITYEGQPLEGGETQRIVSHKYSDSKFDKKTLTLNFKDGSNLVLEKEISDFEKGKEVVVKSGKQYVAIQLLKDKKKSTKMSGGGSTKRGGAMQLAKQIRKDGESWQSALKRANEQMRKK